METLLLVFEIVSGCIAIATFMALVIKPIRNKLFALERIQEGERCVLRSDMLRIYYNNLEKQELRQYEKENFIKLYEAYTALEGNSFIKDIHDEIKTWKVIR